MLWGKQWWMHLSVNRLIKKEDKKKVVKMTKLFNFIKLLRHLWWLYKRDLGKTI